LLDAFNLLICKHGDVVFVVVVDSIFGVDEAAEGVEEGEETRAAVVA
jgi:hypothetical protein